jgi:hypothetical protein
MLALAISPRFIRHKFTTIDFIFSAYILFDALIFICINFFGLGQFYSPYSMLVSFFYFTLLPFTIYFSARIFPNAYIESLKKLFLYLLPLVVTVSLAQIYFSYTNKEMTSAFFLNLYNEGVISYPLQTHEGGYEIRLQGIFYSALGLAVFLIFSSSVVLGLNISKKTKIFILVIFGVMLWLSYNRNGLLAFILFLSLYQLNRFKLGQSNLADRIYPFLAIILLSISIALPFLNSIFDNLYDSSSAITKLSTLSSRAYTWSYLISQKSSELLFGAGYVQGLGTAGDDTLMIDNLFLSKSLQSGVLCAIFLYLFMFLLTTRKNPQKRHVSALFVSSLIMFAANTVFNDINYIVLILGYFVATTSLSKQSNITGENIEHP